jgi:catalase
MIRADVQIPGGPSVLFDSEVLALSDGGAAMLTNEAAAVAIVHDAIAHLKVIGHPTGAQILMDKAAVMPDAGVVPLKNAKAICKQLVKAVSGIANQKSVLSFESMAGVNRGDIWSAFVFWRTSQI